MYRVLGEGFRVSYAGKWLRTRRAARKELKLLGNGFGNSLGFYFRLTHVQVSFWKWLRGKHIALLISLLTLSACDCRDEINQEVYKSVFLGCVERLKGSEVTQSMIMGCHAAASSASSKRVCDEEENKGEVGK